MTLHDRNQMICRGCLVQACCTDPCDEYKLPYSECKTLCLNTYKKCFYRNINTNEICDKVRMYRQILSS